MTFFAYKNRWGSVYVKPHDLADVVDALKSPSVVGVIRFLEMETLSEAESAAKRRFASGEFEMTFGGEQPPPTKTMNTDKKTNLELLPAQPNQKEIDLNIKAMHLAVDGHFRAEKLLYAYAAIGGACANRIMELAAHGTGEKLLADAFPTLSKSQLHVWRNFAKDLAPHLDQKSYVGLLQAPKLGKKEIPVKKLEGLQEAVKKVLKGKSMVDFHKVSQFAGETKPPGGFRPDQEALKAWLQKNHSGFVGIPFDELPPSIQTEFREQYEHPKLTAEQQAELHRQKVLDWFDDADVIFAEKLYADLNTTEDAERIKAFAKTAADIADAFKDLTKTITKK